jgi:large subunit ribosomal protein L23
MGKYFFAVNPQANKVDIKKGVEELYKVHVRKVNTMKVPGRWKRVRTVAGMTGDWKKAVVTLRAGEKIEVS